MKNHPRKFRFARLVGVLLTLALGATTHAANAPKSGKGGRSGKGGAEKSQDASTPFAGRWALSLSTGAAGWLEVKRENGWYDGSLLWGGGSVLPVAGVNVAEDVLTVHIVREVERKDAQGKTTRKQQLVSTLTARLEGETLKGTRSDPRPNGAGFTQVEFTGKRVPPLPPRPDLAKVKFGAPVTLFNGKDLTGWTLKEPNGTSAWSVEKGTLANRPPEHREGEPRVRTANLRTEREFGDMNLKLEVSVPKGSNSGVYLKGIYEIQVLDSQGKPLDSHNMGALYSRITPSVGAEKAAGEWQTLDMTLVDRHLTVVLNGKTIIDNQPVLGVTGGAMWADESKDGPIYLQGDHGAVAYRNIVVRPVVK